MTTTEPTVPTQPNADDFAHTRPELEAGAQVFGTLTGAETEKNAHIRLKIGFNERKPLARLVARYGLPAGEYVLTTGHSGETQFKFCLQPHQIPDPIRSDNGAQDGHGYDDLERPDREPDSFYQRRCARLESDLHDADRKNRRLKDDLDSAKGELATGNTAVMLEYQQKLNNARENYRDKVDDLKDAHRREVRSLEDEINSLEKEALKMELTQKSGQDLSNRIMDALEENAPMLVQLLMSINSAGQQPTQGAAAPQGVAPAENGQQATENGQQAQVHVPTIDQIKQQLSDVKPNLSDQEARQIQQDIKNEIQQRHSGGAPEPTPQAEASQKDDAGGKTSPRPSFTGNTATPRNGQETEEV